MRIWGGVVVVLEACFILFFLSKVRTPYFKMILCRSIHFLSDFMILILLMVK